VKAGAETCFPELLTLAFEVFLPPVGTVCSSARLLATWQAGNGK